MLLIITSVSGCRLTYIFHAAAGQYRLITKAVNVQDALESDSLDPSRKELLRTVSLIKEFGEKELGLKKTDNYGTIYLESHTPPIYTVSACPKDKLKRILWWFPVVGEMPYLGFFKLKDAREEGKRLEKRGLDVSIGIAGAYSTLGWFEDPVTLNLLDKSIVGLAETILHEMTHTTQYIKNSGEFNEGLANIVGKFGALSFVRKYYGENHQYFLEAQNNLADERIFSSFIGDLITRLEMTYAAPVSYSEKLEKREHLFSSSLDEFALLRERFTTDNYVRFGRSGLNNAYVLAIGLYVRHFNLFESFYQKNFKSIPEMLAFFQSRAKVGENLLDLIKNPSEK